MSLSPVAAVSRRGRHLRGLLASSAMLLLLVVGCGGKSSGAKTPGAKDTETTPDAGPVLVRAISIAWALEAIDETADEPARTRVSIAITNETGSTSQEQVGVFEGACKDARADTTNPEVLLALRCETSKGGAVLHMVKRLAGLVFLRAHVFPGETELSFDVLKTFPLPAGAVIKVGQ